MKKFWLVTMSVMLFLSAFMAGAATSATAKEAKQSKILEFDTMVGVPPTLTGAQSQAAFRGLNGGGAPWTLTAAHGELTVSGHLEIQVVGLVLSTTGANPAAVFRARVSCVNSDGSFNNDTLTDAFPATTGLAKDGGGNAHIEADVTLPQPCIAPIIFVTNNNGAWFAATGN
jgi:hypothetical protein